MTTAGSRKQQVLLLRVPIDQPISIRSVKIPAQPRGDKVSLAEFRIYFTEVLAQPLEHFKGNESALASWREHCSRHRDTGLGAGFIVLRVGVGFMCLVCVSLVVDGALDDVLGSWREDVESSLHVEDLIDWTQTVSSLP